MRDRQPGWWGLGLARSGPGSARCYLGDTELAHALEFVPAVQSPTEEAQHPQITPATELPDAPALGQDVSSQPPTVRHGVPIGATHKAPTPDQRQGDDRFEEEQARVKTGSPGIPCF